MLIEYQSNNSGGRWWLTDENWKALEKAGWKVDWMKKRWLGALAKYASKEFEGMRECLAEFEKITGLDPSNEGCNCCGAPHYFTSNELEWGCFGERCLKYMYNDVPNSYREALEKLNKKEGE